MMDWSGIIVLIRNDVDICDAGHGLVLFVMFSHGFSDEFGIHEQGDVYICMCLGINACMHWDHEMRAC